MPDRTGGGGDTHCQRRPTHEKHIAPGIPAPPAWQTNSKDPMRKLPLEIQKSLLADPVAFARFGSGLKLRSYQEAVMRALARSVLLKQGLSFVVMFPRQSGK